jgi:hypothetical protein
VSESNERDMPASARGKTSGCRHIEYDAYDRRLEDKKRISVRVAHAYNARQST